MHVVNRYTGGSHTAIDNASLIAAQRGCVLQLTWITYFCLLSCSCFCLFTLFKVFIDWLIFLGERRIQGLAICPVVEDHGMDQGVATRQLLPHQKTFLQLQP